MDLLPGIIVVTKYHITTGTEDFLLRNPRILDKCVTVSTTQCNKDTGDRGKLQSWSRGHLFIVRP